MIPKYHIEYGIEFGGHREAHVRDFQTDDPVTCESFLVLRQAGKQAGILACNLARSPELSLHSSS